jgi:glycosyltransferase involved in cell wall biosynthesis
MVTGSFPPMNCGVGDYTANFVRALSRSPDMQVAVLTSRGAAPSTGSGPEILPVMERWSLREILRAARVIRQWLPDVVHIQYPTQGYGRGKLPWFLPLLSYVLGRRVVQTWHGGYGRSVGEFVKFWLTAAVPGSIVTVYAKYDALLHPRYRAWMRRKKPTFIANTSSIPRIPMDDEGRRAVRARYSASDRRLVVFFGFVYPYKGVELLFDIADPATDHVVIAGAIGDPAYDDALRQRSNEPAWRTKVTRTGFLPPEEIAGLLQAADAVVLPFRQGGGDWNTSMLGAVANGAFVLTTSRTESGYDARRNVYFAGVDNVEEMTRALNTHAGVRRPFDHQIDSDGWERVSSDYRAVYDRAVGDRELPRAT